MQTVKCPSCSMGMIVRIGPGCKCTLCGGYFTSIETIVLQNYSVELFHDAIRPLSDSELPPEINRITDDVREVVRQEQELIHAGWEIFHARVEWLGYTNLDVVVFLWALTNRLHLNLNDNWIPADVLKTLTSDANVVNLRRYLARPELQRDVITEFSSANSHLEDPEFVAEELFLTFCLAVGSHRIAEAAVN